MLLPGTLTTAIVGESVGKQKRIRSLLLSQYKKVLNNNYRPQSEGYYIGGRTGLAVKFTVVLVRRDLKCLQLLHYDFWKESLHRSIVTIEYYPFMCRQYRSSQGAPRPCVLPPRIPAYSPLHLQYLGRGAFES